jgi:polar amino acid transport system substrate-binding protein
MQKLLAGRVAAVALGGGDAVRLVRGKVAEQVEIVHTPLEQKPYYLMLSHAFVAKHPAQAERIWKAIEQVRTSAAYQQRAQAVIQQAGGRH